MEKGSELLRWLSKPERPGCLAYPLWLLVIVGPLLPIIPIAGIEHDGIKEPSTLYIVSAVCAPVILLVLLGATNKPATLSRAYLYSFVLISVLSVVYLGCKNYAHNHHYGYMGHDLIIALVLTPLYLAAVSLLFFIIETIAERSASHKREHYQRLRPLNGPRDASQTRK
ncbi:MAG: hypothetical protein IKW84_00060 [Bacteroidaceae bacterium]|nr:hypothetical protein [Bacteroidaceae bacterium]MBR5157964.1 hypothetical protein [Bacteroidaceae bacterium]